MKNVISILKFVNNPASGENISLGLVAISSNRIFFKISYQKLQLAKKLNPKNAKLLDFSINQLSSYISHDLEPESNNKTEFKSQLNSSVLDRLARYNNGLLQFSSPSAINSEINDADFYNIFDQFIGHDDTQIMEPKALHVPSKLFSNLESKFIAPLSDCIDVKITVKKKQLPSLFFDFSLDGLGVNGSLYVVKSMDLSIIKAPAAKANISEYESLLDRLIDFSKSKGINGTPVTYLVMDAPEKDKSSELSNLYRFLINERMKYFEVISSDALSSVSSEIIRNKVRKFSQDLLPAG